TDYGLKDSYVAEVKGAILKINPNVTIVDISHDVGNYDIEEGAFHLARSVPYFPDGTIHVGVVDPTVGSERKRIVIKSKGAYFVGPDNGLLAPAAERLGLEKVYEITNLGLLPKRVSEVFDGRDVFGPVAALLSKGFPIEEIGSETRFYQRIPSYEPKIQGNRIEARVIHVDGFGNLVTNVTSKVLEEAGVRDGVVVEVRVGNRVERVPFVKRFSAVPRGALLMLVAGGDYLELSINQGDASLQLGVGRGATLQLLL
ncbi:SAM-dependent chlorinase/fluorinase, partial [Candidatus Bathyarchaeota archaeon]|nr:SAM-dependent chlorinase/fluorinase [Candidatus Bathyarchaeota archaeon]